MVLICVLFVLHSTTNSATNYSEQWIEYVYECWLLYRNAGKIILLEIQEISPTKRKRNNFLFLFHDETFNWSKLIKWNDIIIFHVISIFIYYTDTIAHHINGECESAKNTFFFMRIHTHTHTHMSCVRCASIEWFLLFNKLNRIT